MKRVLLLLMIVAPLIGAIDVEGTARDSAIVTPPLSMEPPLRLAFFGDIMLERRLEDVIARNGTDWLFDGVRELPDGTSLRDLDLVGANLEGAVTAGGAHGPPVYPYDFAFPPERVAAAVAAGISYFTIANNHLWDQGENGVVETRENLRLLGVGFSGDVDTRVTDHSATILERAGRRIGTVGLSGVYGALRETAVQELLREVEQQSDVVIVNVHWGVEYEHIAHPAQRRLARVLVESGADLVLGHHPHVTQGMEVIDGVPVFYSLGNFVFDQAFSEATQQGLAVRVDLRDDLMRIELLPFQSVAFQPQWRYGEDRRTALAEIADWSFGDDNLRARIRSGEFVLNRLHR